jgi:gluconate 5-dehydrogenase
LQAKYLEATFGLNGRTALITGAAGGLGRAIAAALGRAGARVVINGRDPARCADAQATLVKQGIDALSTPFDVTDDAAVAGAEATLREQGINVDILITVAGVQNRKPVTDMTLAEWKALMDVHVNGTFTCVKAFVPGMLARGYGRIILMSSVAGEATLPNVPAYATAKGAIGAFTRALAVDYGGRGITVNALAPGFVRTSLTRALQGNPDFQKYLTDSVPAGRWGEPDDIGPAVVYLASPGASFVNGHILTIDGGMLAKL